MVIVGVILLVLGLFTGVGILVTLGAIVLVVGLLLYVMGAVGRPVAGRKHYW